MLIVLERIEHGKLLWIGSEVLDLEIEKTPDPVRRARVSLSLSLVTSKIELTEAVEARALHLQGLGFHALDALHLASAEEGHVDVFLTTDERLIRPATRHASEIHVRVENPLTWITSSGKS